MGGAGPLAGDRASLRLMRQKHFDWAI